jgi:hypothetical protein
MSFFYFDFACDCQTFFGLRMYQSIHMGDVTILFDKELWGMVEDIVVGAGFGLYSAVETTLYVFMASKVQSLVLQDRILRVNIVWGINSDFRKARHVLVIALFGKSVKDIEVNFT